MLDAVRSVLDATTGLMQTRGIDAPLRFTAALADGEQVWAFRWAWAVIHKILDHLGLDPQPPPKGRARELGLQFAA